MHLLFFLYSGDLLGVCYLCAPLSYPPALGFNYRNGNGLQGVHKRRLEVIKFLSCRVSFATLLVLSVLGFCIRA